jgi:hypothetical protein
MTRQMGRHQGDTRAQQNAPEIFRGVGLLESNRA